MIRLYDTARKEKVELKALEENKVGVYDCGPTVYDKCHVGHARVYVAFDVVIRHLRNRGYQTIYVRNVTDVEDKIIKRAAQMGEDPLSLSARFTDQFHIDMKALGNLDPDHEPRVSDHITQIIELIERIIADGFAYQIEGDVYFEVDRFPAYGSLSPANRSTETSPYIPRA